MKKNELIPLRFSSVNVTKSEVPSDFVTSTEEVLN